MSDDQSDPVFLVNGARLSTGALQRYAYVLLSVDLVYHKDYMYPC